MNANTWLIIAIVGFSLAGAALAAAIFMFIKMNIPAIIGDLTGKTVAREIKAMRAANALSGDKRFKSSKVNLERGTLTEKADAAQSDKNIIGLAHSSKRLDRTANELSRNIDNKRSGTVGLSEVNSVKQMDTLNDNLSEPTEILKDNSSQALSGDETKVLGSVEAEMSDVNSTKVLSADATDVLSDGTAILAETAVSDATTVLDATAVLNGTTVLNPTEELNEEQEITPVAFKVTKDIIMTHTDEVI